MDIRFDRSLLRTVLFSVAVVSFVIGTYQTVEQNDKTALMDNDWLFMVSFGCVLFYRYLGRTEPPLPPAASKPASPGRRKAAPAKPKTRK